MLFHLKQDVTKAVPDRKERCSLLMPETNSYATRDSRVQKGLKALSVPNSDRPSVAGRIMKDKTKRSVRSRKEEKWLF